MPCGPNFEAKQCREKVGPTSIRSSMRARKRHIVKRLFSHPNAKNPSKVPIQRDVRQHTTGTDYVRFKIWRSATKTAFCPSVIPKMKNKEVTCKWYEFWC